MAISLDVAASSSSTAASPLTWTHTVGGGSNTLLIVALGLQSGGSTQPTATAVTYNGVSMVKARGDQKAAPSLDYETSIWFLMAPPAGAHTVSVTWTFGAISNLAAGTSISYFGALQSNTPDAVNGLVGTSAAANNFNVTTVADNCWVVAVGTINGGISGTLTDTNTSRGAVAEGSGTMHAEDTNGPNTPAGAQSVGFTTGGTGLDGWAMSAASFAPAAAGTTAHNLMMLGIGN